MPESEREDESDTPEGLALRRNFVVAGAQIAFHYQVGCLHFEDPAVSVSCVAVSEVNGQVLVAVPDKAWHRVKKSRLIPSDALQKTVRVQVQPSSTSDRMVPEGITSLKLWLGLLKKDYEHLAEFDEEDVDIDFPVETDGQRVLPYAQSLVAIAQDHFAFVTAESERNPPQDYESRLSSVESNLQEVLKQLQKLTATAPTVASSALGAAPKSHVKKAASLRSPPFIPPGLDPATAQQALAAGVSAEALEDMAAFLDKRPMSAKVPAAQPIPEEVISTDEEEEVEPQFAGSGSAPMDPVGSAVVQLTKLVSHLHQEKKTRKDQGLEAILDRAEGGSTKDITTASRSKAAALRALQRLLVSNPTLIYQSIERRMQEDFDAASSLPGTSISRITARAWLEHRSRIQSFPSSIRMGWIMAGTWDALWCNRPEEARARLALGVAALDQQACDKGAWLVAGELTSEESPPYHSFTTHQAPESFETPHTRLVDSR